MADNDSYKEDYYFKFGAPGGADYDPSCEASASRESEFEDGKEITPENTHFNRAALNVDQYNYLASRINQIRKVRPLTFEDHYRMYPYRSGEMIVPKDLYTIEWEVNVSDFDSADGLIYPNGFYWAESMEQAKEHYFRLNPAQSENDIIYTTVIDPNVDDGPLRWDVEDGYIADAILNNGSRCGHFVEWEDDKGGPCKSYNEDGECTAGYGYWTGVSNQYGPLGCCKRVVDEETEEEIDECQTTDNGMTIFDDERLEAASDVKIFEIVSVLHYTGWALNRGGGAAELGLGHMDASWAGTAGEYMLDTYSFGGAADWDASRYPYDGVYLHQVEKTDHPYWLNIVNKLNNANEDGYGLEGEVGSSAGSTPVDKEVTEIPLLDQVDYPAEAIEDGWFGDIDNKDDELGTWASLMEESGAALSDSIRSHSYDITVEPVKTDTDGDFDFDKLSPLKSPEGMGGQWWSFHPSLRRKVGTQFEEIDLQANYEDVGEWVECGNMGENLCWRPPWHTEPFVQTNDIGDYEWGNLPVDYYLNLSKTTKFDIVDEEDEDAYEIVDPLVYDEGIEYDIYSENDIEKETKDYLRKQPGCSQGENAGAGGGAGNQACAWECKEWDKLGYSQYVECYHDCWKKVEDGDPWVRSWPHGSAAGLPCTRYRLVDATSYHFNLPKQSDTLFGTDLLAKRIWHEHFHDVERIRQEAGIGPIAGDPVGGPWEPFVGLGHVGSLQCSIKRWFCMDQGAIPENEGGMYGGGQFWTADSNFESPTNTCRYGTYGKVTEFDVAKRHVNNYSSEMGCHGAKDSEPAMKRRDMLLHPAFHEDGDPLGYFDELSMLDSPGGGYGESSEGGMYGVGHARNAAAGYQAGIQANLYNGFTLPPYVGAPGRHGHGKDDRWVKDGEHGVSLDAAPEDKVVKGYTENGVKKVHWVEAEAVQRRAEELGFHFEFRRLAVPYKMIETKFDHEVSKFARMSGNALYVDDKWTSNLDYQRDRNWCQQYDHAGESDDKGTLTNTYEEQDAWSKTAYSAHHGNPSYMQLWRGGCGVRSHEWPQGPAGPAPFNYIPQEKATDGGARFTLGLNYPQPELDAGDNDPNNPTEIDPDADIPRNWTPATQADPVLGDGKTLAEGVAGYYGGWTYRTTPVYFPRNGIVFNEVDAPSKDDEGEPVPATLPGGEGWNAHSQYPNTKDGDHAGYWGQLGSSNRSHAAWWGGYDSHSVIFMGKPYIGEAGYAMGQTKNWAGTSRSNGPGAKPIIGGLGRHGMSDDAPVYLGGQSQFYQLHIRSTKERDITYLDYEGPGERGNQLTMPRTEENAASDIAEAGKGDPSFITRAYTCAPWKGGCVEGNKTETYIEYYKNWSAAGVSLSWAQEDQGSNAMPYKRDGVWPINVANLANEAGIDAYYDGGVVAGLHNVFDTIPGDRRFHTEAGDYLYNLPGDSSPLGRRGFKEQKEEGCHAPGADLLLVQMGEWEEGKEGAFEFKTRGYMPHVKKTHQFAAAASEEETEWVRPIGLGTLKHVTEPFSGYDMFVTDFVKAQSKFSCDPHKQSDDAEWGEPEWERDETCEPSRFENARPDNGGSYHSGNMIFAAPGKKKWQQGGAGPSWSLEKIPINALIERDSMATFLYDSTAYVQLDLCREAHCFDPPDEPAGDPLPHDGEIFDNIDLLAKNPLTWTAEHRNGEHLQPTFPNMEKFGWTSPMGLMAGDGRCECPDEDAEDCCEEASIKFNSVRLSDWFTKIPLADGGHKWILGIPQPAASFGIWGSDLGLFDADRPDTAVNNQPLDSNPAIKLDGVMDVFPDDCASVDQYGNPSPCRDSARLAAAVHFDAIGGNSASKVIEDSWRKQRDEIIFGAVSGFLGDSWDAAGDAGWGPTPAYTSLGGIWRSDYPAGRRIAFITGADVGQNAGDDCEPQEGDICHNEPIVGYSNLPHPRFCAGCQIDLADPDDKPYDRWLFNHVDVKSQKGRNAPHWSSWSWPTTADYVADVGTYPFAIRDGIGGPGGGLAGGGAWDPGEDGGFVWGSEDTYGFYMRGLGIGGAAMSFINISLYDMIYHYDQTPILKVMNDGDQKSFELYKAEALKLTNRRNPSALLYQDYTDYYSSSQYNQVFMFGEEDYQFDIHHESDYTDSQGKDRDGYEGEGYALSSLYLNEPIRTEDFFGVYDTIVGQGGPGDEKNMVNSFLRMSTDGVNFGGRGATHFASGPTSSDWSIDLEPNAQHGMYAWNIRPSIWRPILKVSSMPMADSNFIPKRAAGNFSASHQSIMDDDEKNIGLCDSCEKQNFFIGGTAVATDAEGGVIPPDEREPAITTAVNFYIDNMIDLSPQKDELAVKVERTFWRGPKLSPIASPTTCSCTEIDNAWWCICSDGTKWGQGGDSDAVYGYSQQSECVTFCDAK